MLKKILKIFYAKPGTLKKFKKILWVTSQFAMPHAQNASSGFALRTYRFSW